VLALVVVVDLRKAADQLRHLRQAPRGHRHGRQRAGADAPRGEHGPDPADGARRSEPLQARDHLALPHPEPAADLGEGALAHGKPPLVLVEQAAVDLVEEQGGLAGPGR
jgi:hypothetical protein